MTPEQLDRLRDQIAQTQDHMQHILKIDRLSADFWNGNISGLKTAQDLLWHARRASGEEDPIH